MQEILNHRIVISHLTCVRGNRPLYKDLSFALKSQHLLFVQGKNGSGKTTLLRSICGLTNPDAGTVEWDGTNISTLAEEYSAQLLYIGHHTGLKDDLTAIENLTFFANLSGLEVARTEAIRALEALGIAHCADLPSRVLSQGQKRRVALARLWLSHKPLWVLDEPFAALDVATISVLTSHIEQFVSSGGMVVFTSHQEPNFSIDAVQRLSLS